jgi:tetraacyldisaccharide 4'-kinase
MIKPKFWDKEIGLISILLLPFSLIVLFLIFLKRNFTKNNTFNIPVICVGNIYIGGTGKTPMSIFLSKELVRLGKKTVIIRKFYKEHIDEHKTHLKV